MGKTREHGRNGTALATAACLALSAIICTAMMLGGCSQQAEEQEQGAPTTATKTRAAQTAGTDMTGSDAQEVPSMDEMPQVEVRFGTSGTPFLFAPEKNETSLYLVRNITSSGRNLPIYSYEGYEGDDVMQYYDVPSRFDVPSEPSRVTSEKAGEVYLSAPNRVMLFFEDAQMEGEFTYLGRIEDTTGLANAVRDNPTVPGYSNKIIAVSYD